MRRGYVAEHPDSEQRAWAKTQDQGDGTGNGNAESSPQDVASQGGTGTAHYGNDHTTLIS